MTNAATRFLERRERALSCGGRACYRAYTHLFVPFALLTLIALPLNWRGLIWIVDGMSQYYPFFIYEGQWIRGIFENLLAGNGLQIPLWEWTSGYGADVITTFDVLFDPLNLVSAITPGWASEWVFQALVVLRLYLSGLAFVFYAQTRGENRCGTVLGALLYALCGAGLTGVRWASGLHALILFPVILAGAERILAGKRPWVFIASLTGLAIVSYYFTYMACMLLVGYLALRVVMIEGNTLTPRRFFRWVGIFAGLVIMCLALSGFALVPSVYSLMGMDRLVDRSTTTPLLYGMRMYSNILATFASINDVGSDTYQGFGGLALLACAALFAEPKRNRELKLTLLVLTAILFIPLAGSFLNGLNYATNRWTWAYALCVAFVLARMTPSLLRLSDGQRTAMVAAATCYALLLFLLPLTRNERNMAGLVALMASLAVVILLQGSAVRRSLLAGTLALCLATNRYYFLAADETDIGRQQNVLGTSYATLTSNSLDSIALDSNDASWWRYDAAQSFPTAPHPINRVRNNSLVLGVNGIDFYNSVYNDGIDAFHTELAIAGDYINFSYNNLQGRSDLMSLLGVKYYVYRKDGGDTVPYSFSKEREVAQRTILGFDYRLLRSDCYLPFGSTFDRFITYEDYLALSPAQRQQALLQAIVLEEDPANKDGLTSTSALQFEDASIPFRVTQTDGVAYEDGVFDAQYSGATVTLEFEGTPEADTYLYLKGLEYRVKKPSERLSEEELAALSFPKRVQLLYEDIMQGDPTMYEIRVQSNAANMTGYLDNYLSNNHMFGGKDTWLVATGYADGAATRVSLTFNNTGIYTFDSMQVITQTHKHKSSWVEEHTDYTLQGVELGTNRIAGTIDLNQHRMLFVPVAYSSGWTAYVDNQEVPVLRANTGFMAIELDAGQHNVEMHYRTPGLYLGLAVSSIGVLALLVLLLRLRRQ